MLNFIGEYDKVSEKVHSNAIDKGWWKEERNEGELIALIHSELSEGLEALRSNKQSNKIPGFLGIEEELADVIIRIMDYGGAKRYRVAEALIAKIYYNEDRDYKHGKLF